jgi:hypothetical protein
MGQAAVRDSLFLRRCSPQHMFLVTPHVSLFGVRENMTTLLLR